MPRCSSALPRKEPISQKTADSSPQEHRPIARKAGRCFRPSLCLTCCSFPPHAKKDTSPSHGSPDTAQFIVSWVPRLSSAAVAVIPRQREQRA
jgi:hypothetical protein